MDSNLRREIILENYQDPLNRGLVEDDSYLKVNTNSESCIDNLDFMMKIDNGKIMTLYKSSLKSKFLIEDKLEKSLINKLTNGEKNV